MKIGVSSYSFKKAMDKDGLTYIDICDKAKEMGFEGIEFSGIDTAKYSHGEDDIECAKNIAEHCREIGLEVINFAVGANFLADDIDAELKKIFHCVDIAEALGAPVMRHDICSKLPAKHLYNWENAKEDIAPYIRRVTEYAASKGIRTCSENHGLIFQAPERVEALIREVGSENYGWLCDIGNFLCADADPLRSVAIAAPYTFHAHVKDFLFKPAELGKPESFFVTKSGNFLRGTILGHGIVPVKECIGLLKKAGYDGWVSLEFEGLEDNMKALEMGYRYLKAAIEK